MSPVHDEKGNAFQEVIALLKEQGFEGMRETAEMLMNEAMKIERAEALGASPYERTAERKGYANGFKPKTVNTRLGSLALEVPQARGVEFYPKSLERGCRSERALKAAIAEMYVNGVSTRRVKKITEELCGLEISSTQVSRVCELLDGELEKFRNRTLGKYEFVFLDARYEKVRQNGHVVDAALLVATGVNPSGKREVLGLSVKISEAEVHWREFLSSLQARGLSGIELITSDDHSGLKAARKAVFPGVLWQRCQFHFAQNAQSYAPKVSMREEIGIAVRSIFSQQKLEDARAQVKRVAEEFKSSAPQFSTWLETDCEECFAAYAFPERWHMRLRTNNGSELLNREIKRRTRLVGVFPNEQSLLRLASAVLAEIHEDWLLQPMPFINLKLRSQQEPQNVKNKISDIYRRKVA